MRPLPGPPTIPRKGIDMRRLLALPITAFLALLLTGTVAAGGPNVQNISGGATIPQADWETSDANGGYTSGYAAASVEQGQSAAYLEFSQQSVTWVLCSDAGTPNDESDDVYGSVGSFSYGNGPATLTLGKSYSSASASAALDVDTFTFDECPGTKGESQSSNVQVAFDLMANGPLIKQSGRGTFHVPGQFNDHHTFRSTSRAATGSVSIGGASIDANGAIGKVNWSEHTNA